MAIRESVDQHAQSPLVPLLALAVLALGISALGWLSYRHYEDHFRAAVERELTAVAELKTNELARYRSARLRDGSILLGNTAFSELVEGFFEHRDGPYENGLRTWLTKILHGPHYDRIFLLDAAGTEQMSVPKESEPVGSVVSRAVPEVLKSGQVVLQDFYRDENDDRVYLAVMVPVLNAREGRAPVGVLALRIDPATQLYPIIRGWPTPSQSAETLLVRRDGNDALFLNDLRFQPHAALTFRLPLERQDAPAVQAILGREGVIEGRDYRGVAVIAGVRAVPDSPWFLVARMDLAEAFAPLGERWWGTIVVGASLFLALVAIAGSLWWGQRWRGYRRRYEAAEALAARDRRYRKLVERGWDVTTLVDREGVVRYSSDSVTRTFGYTVEEYVGRGLAETVHPDDLARVTDILRTLTSEPGSAQRAEMRGRHKDGRWLWMDVTATNRLDDPDIAAIVVHSRDVSEQVRAAEALRASEARLRLVVKATNVGFYDWDLRTNRLRYSREWKQQIGYEDEEISDSFQEWQSRVHPDDLNRCLEAIRSWGGRDRLGYELEFRFRHRDGSYRWIMTQAAILHDEQGIAVRAIGSHVDITERKRAEEALRESAARLSGIVESAMDGIVTVDEDETILLFNAAAEKIFGCPAALALGQRVERFMPERFRAAHPQHIQRFGETGDTERAHRGFMRISGVRANGEEFPIEASISRAKVEGHMLFTIILRDVTERVRGEEARAQLEAQLRLAQKMEALGTLAGGVAHDFNNILGAIIGNVELAAQDVGRDHPAMESLGEIRKASHRARDLVQGILAFSSGRAQEQTVISLRLVLEEAVTLLRATLPAGIELTTRFDPDTPNVWADPTQIHQVVLNLCTNAWHAMGGKPGHIGIRLDGVTLGAGEIVDSDLRPGRFARLSVTDDGSGIDAATRERIFEPFFTTKPIGQGTGLGLSVVHGIVKAHGGAITVASELGRGSTFSIYLPAVEGGVESAAPEGPAPDLSAATANQHVLYLDDEEALVFLVTRTLERLGYKVSGYTAVEEALAAVRAGPGQFDLVVTDYNMPGHSGLDVAREVARLRPDLPVVLASGYITEELRAAAPQAGVRHLIYKPNTAEELCSVVRRFLDRATEDGQTRE